jgi:hypothetical protein
MGKTGARARLLLWCLALLAIMASGGSDGGGRGAPSASTHMRVGIALLADSGYHAWLDAESIVAALIRPPTLRASLNTSWSFEVFCAQAGAAPRSAALSTTARSQRCPDKASAGALGILVFESSVATGETLGAWAARLDRLITLGVAPPPDLCVQLGAQRAATSATAVPNGAGVKAATRDNVQKHGEGKKGRESGGATCFFLPDSALMSEAHSWQLWHTHTMRTTEVPSPRARMLPVSAPLSVALPAIGGIKYACSAPLV